MFFSSLINVLFTYKKSLSDQYAFLLNLYMITLEIWIHIESPLLRGRYMHELWFSLLSFCDSIPGWNFKNFDNFITFIGSVTFPRPPHVRWSVSSVVISLKGGILHFQAPEHFFPFRLSPRSEAAWRTACSSRASSSTRTSPIPRCPKSWRWTSFYLGYISAL